MTRLDDSKVGNSNGRVPVGLVGAGRWPVGWTGPGEGRTDGCRSNGTRHCLEASGRGQTQRSFAAAARKAQQLARKMLPHFLKVRKHLGGAVVFQGPGDLYDAYRKLAGVPAEYARGHGEIPGLDQRLDHVLSLSGDACVAAMDELVQDLEPLQGTVPIYNPPKQGQVGATESGRRQPTITSILTSPRIGEEELLAHVSKVLREDVLSLAAAWMAFRKGHVELVPES